MNTRALAITQGNPNTLYAGIIDNASVPPLPPPVIPRIISASVAGKRLFVLGENFDPGAVILLNGEQQITKNDAENPKTSLIGKKAGRKVKPGDKLQVRNPNDSISEVFIFKRM